MLKRAFWLIIILLTAFCAYLAADLLSNYLKMVWDVPPKFTPLASSEDNMSQKRWKSKEYYKIISQRDLFQIAPPEEKGIKALEEETEKVAPLTDLELKLLGTMVGDGIIPFAIIKDLKSRKQDLYREGDKVGPAELLKIYRHKVILHRDGAEEMLIAFEMLESRKGIEKPEVSQVEETSRSLSPGELYSRLGEKVGPNHWVIKRDEMEEVISNANKFLTQIRIIPHFTGGDLNKPDGFQVANIKPRSVFDKMGLKSGDVLKAVNGQPINNPEKAFEAYQRLKDESRIQVDILRNNKEVSLFYDING